MADPNIQQTVRIQLPVREPAGKEPLPNSTQADPGTGSVARNLAASEFSQPVNPPPFSPPLSASVIPAPEPMSSGPKKETARILPISDPLSSASQMKNAQSVIPMAHVVPQNSLIAATASGGKSSMLLWWVLLGVSALILIIQIWTYLS
jgi:hypothetical protein